MRMQRMGDHEGDVYESLGYANKISDLDMGSPYRPPWKILDSCRRVDDRCEAG